MKNVLSLIALFLSMSAAAAPAPSPSQTKAEWRPIARELRKEGLSEPFISFLKKNFEAARHEKVLRLNILGFLNPSNHHALVTDEAAEASVKFMRENAPSLAKSKELFGVDPEVITALLWIETRFGNVRGNYSVPSVFLSLVSGRTKRTQDKLFAFAKRGRTPAYTTDELRAKIESRCERKANWALGELKSIEALYRKNSAEVKAMRGSFAGAFGYPQFLPSSYLKWAYTDRERTPNLGDPHDAILSVGYYLRENGWGTTVEQKKKALFSYNNSADYVEAILNLSLRLRVPPRAT